MPGLRTFPLGPHTLELHATRHEDGVTHWVDERDEFDSLVASEPFSDYLEAREYVIRRMVAHRIQNSEECGHSEEIRNSVALAY